MLNRNIAKWPREKQKEETQKRLRIYLFTPNMLLTEPLDIENLQKIPPVIVVFVHFKGS